MRRGWIHIAGRRNFFVPASIDGAQVGDGDFTLQLASRFECVGGLGGILIGHGTNITVRIEERSPAAVLFAEVFLVEPYEAYLGRSDESGRETNLAGIPYGTELVFKVKVSDFVTTSPHGIWDYFSGPASRNPDGVIHATMTCDGTNGGTLSFEDLYGGGDFSYNDVVIHVEPYDGDDFTLPDRYFSLNSINGVNIGTGDFTLLNRVFSPNSINGVNAGTGDFTLIQMAFTPNSINGVQVGSGNFTLS